MSILRKFNALCAFLALISFSPAFADPVSVDGSYIATMKSNLALNGFLYQKGSGSLSILPKGSPISGSVGTVFRSIMMAHGGVQNFGVSNECTSNSVAPSNGGNVCDYSWMEATPSSGGAWAQSLVTQIDSGFSTTTHTALISEMDLNNLAGDFGEFSTGNSVGLLLNGLGYLNTAAISVQTGNSTSGMTGTNGQLPIWYDGISFRPNSVLEADVDSTSSAYYGIRMHGKHAFALSTADDNTTEGGLQIGDSGPAQGIVARHGGTNYIVLYVAPDGSLHIGNPTQGNFQVDANMLPSVDDSYSLGSSTNRFYNVATYDVNGVPTETTGTPTIGASCIAGQKQFDATNEYMCMSDAKWHTLAKVSD